MSFETVFVFLIGTSVVLAVVYFFFKKKNTPVIEKKEEAKKETAEPVLEVNVKQGKAAPVGLESRLQKTRTSLKDRLSFLFKGNADTALTDGQWESVEEILLEGDVGVHTTQILIERVRESRKTDTQTSLQKLFEKETIGLLAGLEHGPKKLDGTIKPFVISVVGVNGVGKTTTTGKLAQSFIKEGKSVLLGAVDTFRAGAINQLKVWADRTGAEFVTGREGADPGAVAFDSVTAAKARGKDVVLLDTAGRLHTKSNLMEELKKVHRVVKKVIPEAPHETWLVIDGTLGQNSILQAKEFQKTLELTGIIVTKLDGTAKGGAVFSIAQDLKLPIRYIGVGESAEDLIPFEPQPFVEAILGA